MRPGPVMLPTPREFLENLNREACGKMDVAAAMHRRMGYRIGFGELLAEFTGAEQAA